VWPTCRLTALVASPQQFIEKPRGEFANVLRLCPNDGPDQTVGQTVEPTRYFRPFPVRLVGHSTVRHFFRANMFLRSRKYSCVRSRRRRPATTTAKPILRVTPATHYTCVLSATRYHNDNGLYGYRRD